MNYQKKEQTYSLYNPFNRFFFFFAFIKSRKWMGYTNIGMEIIAFFLWYIYFFIFNGIIFNK